MQRVDTKRATHRLTRHTYSLSARRGPNLLLGGIAAACAVSALVAAGFALKGSREYNARVEATCAPPVSVRVLRDELARARLAGDHEAATRAALEQQAAAAAAELARLRTDLAFYRRQRRGSD
jgi:hydroxyethylthiazole kinase-like sugar kinase family protein